MFGVFRVKNHDFTPKNHIFSNFKRGAPPHGSALGMYPFKSVSGLVFVFGVSIRSLCLQSFYQILEMFFNFITQIYTNNQPFKKTEGATKNGQASETGNIGRTRHRTNKRQRKLKGQRRMDKPEKLATLYTQDTGQINVREY